MAKQNTRKARAAEIAAARAQAARLKAEQERKARRSRLLTIIGVAVGLVAVVAIVLVVNYNAGKVKLPDDRPAGATEGGAIALGEDMVAGAKQAKGADVVSVVIYSDYMCPYCGQLEEKFAPLLEQASKEGKVALSLQPISVLDRLSQGTNYSTRASNAAMTVAKYSPEQFFAFHRALFSKQPEENTPGLSDEEIAVLALDTGVPRETVVKFADNEMADWVTFSTDTAISNGITGTPVMTMALGDGKPQRLEKWSTLDLDQAIDNLKAGLPPDGES